jgi:hypothetical protein
LDHLIRPQQKRLRNRDAECFRCLEIDPQLKFRRLLDRKIGRFRAAQDLVDSRSARASSVPDKIADAANLSRRLRSRGARRGGERTGSQRANERPAIHRWKTSSTIGRPTILRFLRAFTPPGG